MLQYTYRNLEMTLCILTNNETTECVLGLSVGGKPTISIKEKELHEVGSSHLQVMAAVPAGVNAGHQIPPCLEASASIRVPRKYDLLSVFQGEISFHEEIKSFLAYLWMK